MIPPIIIIYI